MHYGLLSLIPPVLALFLALYTKNIMLALFTGIVSCSIIVNAPALIMRYSQGETRHISVIDESGVIAPRLESSEEVVYEPTDLTLDEARREHTDRFGILWIGGDIMTNPGNVKLYTNGSSAMLVEESVSGQIADIIEKEKLKDYNIENLSQILYEVKTTVYMQVFRNDQMQDDGSDKQANSSAVSTVVRTKTRTK